MEDFRDIAREMRDAGEVSIYDMDDAIWAYREVFGRLPGSMEREWQSAMNRFAGNDRQIEGASHVVWNNGWRPVTCCWAESAAYTFQKCTFHARAA